MATLTYVIPYALVFPVAADGVAARAANGGSILLGSMTPTTAAATFPAGIVIQLGPWILQGLTGVPGAIPGAYADFTQGIPDPTVSYSPTSRVFATDSLTTITRTTTPPPGAPQTVDTLLVEWDGTLLVEGVDVTLPPTAGPPQPIIGKGQVRVETWTGDGVNGRTIPTPFSLTVGKTAVWVFPNGTRAASFRSTGMTGSISGGIFSTIGGVTGFTTAGFTVADHAAFNVFANQLGQQYTALVFNDTTTDNRLVRVGTYVGWGNISTNGTFTFMSNVVIGGGMTTNEIGRILTITGPGSGTFTITGIIDGTHYTVSPISHLDGLQNFTSSGDNHDLFIGADPSAAWVFGSDCVFRTDAFTGDASVNLGAPYPTVDMIQAFITSALLGSGFQVGADNRVNANGTNYFYLVVTALGKSALAASYQTFKTTGTAATDIVVPLGFQPTFALARPFTTGALGAAWRSPWHAGTDSIDWSSLSTNLQGGVDALGAASVSLGQDVAPNGVDSYGFAMRSGSVIIYADPPSDPPSPPDDPPAPPPPACTTPTLPPLGCLAGADVAPGVAGSGCVAPDFCVR